MIGKLWCITHTNIYNYTININDTSISITSILYYYKYISIYNNYTIIKNIITKYYNIT